MNATPKQLPVVKIANKEFFRDDRLKEYRNTKNPHEKYTFEEMANIFRFVDVGTQLMNTIAAEAKLLGMIIQSGQTMGNEDVLHIVTQDGELITVLRNFAPDEETLEAILGDEDEEKNEPSNV